MLTFSLIIFFCSMCCFHFSVFQAMHLSCLCLLHIIINIMQIYYMWLRPTVWNHLFNTHGPHWIPSISCKISNWMTPPLLNCSVLTLFWNVHTSSRGIIKASSLIGWIGRTRPYASSCAAVPAERQIFVLPSLSQAQSMQGRDSHRKLFPAPPRFVTSTSREHLIRLLNLWWSTGPISHQIN